MTAEGFIVGSKCRVVEVQRRSFIWNIIETEQRPCDLTCPVTPDVVEDDDVSLFNATVCFGIYPVRKQEFISDPLRIGVGEDRFRIIRELALPLDKQPISFLSPLPAMVPVQRKVAADDGSQLTRPEFGCPSGELAIVIETRSWGSIPAIGEGVNPDMIQVIFLRHRHQSKNVLIVAMDSPVREQPHQMDLAAFGSRTECSGQRFILHEAAITDVFVDPRELLPDDAPGSYIEMPHLGVAELTFWQPDIGATGREPGVRTGFVK